MYLLTHELLCCNFYIPLTGVQERYYTGRSLRDISKCNSLGRTGIIKLFEFSTEDRIRRV